VSGAPALSGLRSDPYAKAKYLHDLYINQKLSISEILDFCGGAGRWAEIAHYIDAFKDKICTKQISRLLLLRQSSGLLALQLVRGIAKYKAGARAGGLHPA
jgi:hypothetical protein